MLHFYFNSRPHGGRLFDDLVCSGACYFNSRPHGGRLMVRRLDAQKEYISTHALTEGDGNPELVEFMTEYFNSRPHGGRPGALEDGPNGEVFQLTPSRRATRDLLLLPDRESISTHALTEGDQK